MRYFIIRGRKVVSFEERVSSVDVEAALAQHRPAGLVELCAVETDASWSLDPVVAREVAAEIGGLMVVSADEYAMFLKVLSRIEELERLLLEGEAVGSISPEGEEKSAAPKS